MRKSSLNFDRRSFIKTTTALTAGLTGFTFLPQQAWSMDHNADEGMNVIGPKEGYSPQVGTLVSMMNWMREVILKPVKGMTMEQLDYLHDGKSNTIGAMLLHLAATERYYQLHTFDGMKWGTWDESIKKQWNTPMRLGEDGRKNIKGNNLDFYLNSLKEVREKTLQELKKRDDKWLMTVDKEWGWGPTNNYCKWFHVVEHESNHNGQIKWIKSRLPGAKESGE
jgi:hypothetical protein